MPPWPCSLLQTPFGHFGSTTYLIVPYGIFSLLPPTPLLQYKFYGDHPIHQNKSRVNKDSSPRNMFKFMALYSSVLMIKPCSSLPGIHNVLHLLRLHPAMLLIGSAVWV